MDGGALMKFNFSCWALCLIEVETDPDDPEWRNVEAYLLGLYLTQEDAEGARVAFELANLERHKQVNKRAVEQFGWRAEVEYVPRLYASVPIFPMGFRDWDDFEEIIQKAAKLSFLEGEVKS
jgi:hypothetical protein